MPSKSRREGISRSCVPQARVIVQAYTSFYKKVGVGIEFEFTVGVRFLAEAITTPGENFFSMKASHWLDFR